MKKITTLLLILFFSFSQAQLPVSQSPENKNVILEEFTGISCGFCPDGHRIAQLVHDAHPNDVVLVNIHTGSFATPSANEPDFRTSFGNAIASQSQLAGYPAGTINRHYFGHSQQGSPSGATALSRSTWQSDANTILGQPAYLNVALEATVDVQTREMTINVEVYYTGNSPEAQNLLNVVLLQNNVEGPQSGSSANPSQVLPNGNYNHMHMLRHMITGQWGDPITTTAQGTLIQRQYTYTLPADINGIALNLGDLEIAAFVSETHQEIINGSMGSISYTVQYATNAAALDVLYNDNICNSNDLNAKVKVTNSGSDAITAMTIEYNVNNGATQTLNWTGDLNSLGTKVIDLPNFSFTIEPTNTLNINIVSVNGTTDENTDDNTNTVNFNKTGNNGTGTDYVVTIVQDQYGTESSWVITDSAGNLIANGGPYSNLTSAGTQTHTHNVTLNNNDCYTFHMLDSYGDGMNGGYGAGYYKLEQADGTLVLQGDGIFGSEDNKYFEIDGAAGINESAFNDVNITPNPSDGLFTFENVADTDIIIYNSLGEQVYAYHQAPLRLDLNLSFLSNGVYFAHLQKQDKLGIKKIIIKH